MSFEIEIERESEKKEKEKAGPEIDLVSFASYTSQERTLR